MVTDEICDDGVGGIIEGEWRKYELPVTTLFPLEKTPKGHNSSTEAKKVREYFNDYFINEGAVSWQWGSC